MSLHRWTLVFLLLGSAWSGSALGAERKEQRSVNVSTGRETRIAYYGSPDAKCNAGPNPQITIAETPSYGTIGFKTMRLRAMPYSIPERDGPCIGKFIDVTAVYYRPTAGFHGSDRIRVRVKFERSPQAADAMILEEQIFVSVR